MKKNILKNITLDRGEKVYKDFRKINAKGYSCQILLTTKRLIIFSKGMVLSRGKKARHKRMNEIDLNSIHRLEYYIEYIKYNIWVRLIGFLIFAGALFAGYMLYMGKIPVPASIPYLPYTKYAAAGLIALIGVFMMVRVSKTLYLKINSGTNEKTIEKFDVNKYNELTVRYIASKVRTGK
ncbi:MAG: hypothetical protein KAU02_04810 [Tenericutes bacterium]|nr:hypothetical protein [Mycoplasmatota bacterium]